MVQDTKIGCEFKCPEILALFLAFLDIFINPFHLTVVPHNDKIVFILYRISPSNIMTFDVSQFHLLQCPALTTKLIVDSTVKLKDSFVYGNVEQQLLYVKIYAEFWKLREEVLKERKKQENVTTL